MFPFIKVGTFLSQVYYVGNQLRKGGK